MAYIQGDNNANTLIGTVAADTIVALGGNDTVTGGGGNDSIDGDGGVDTAVLTGTMGQYTFNIKVNAYSWQFSGDWETHWVLNSVDTVGGRDGNDAMTDVDYLQFAGSTVRWHDVPLNMTVDSATSAQESVVLMGGIMNDTLTGHDGADLLIGGQGNDVIDGKGGLDDMVVYTSFNTYVTMTPLQGGVSVNLQTGVATGPWGNDTIINVEQVAGTAYADVLTGNASPNYLIGNPGNDTMRGGAGDDSMLGGNGVDWSLFAGNYADYTLYVFGVTDDDSSDMSITDNVGNDGQDGMWLVERLQFADIGYAFDLDGSAGTAARLIGVLMGEQYVSSPVVGKIAISALDSGMSAETLADLALDALYPGASLQALASVMYKNVFHADATPDIVNFLVAVMQSTSPEFIAVYASTMAENDASIDFAGLAYTGVPFLPIL